MPGSLWLWGNTCAGSGASVGQGTRREAADVGAEGRVLRGVFSSVSEAASWVLGRIEWR